MLGSVMVLGIIAVVALSIASFRGSFRVSDPLFVVAPRAGLVLNPGAKVKLRDVQIGRVASIDDRDDGRVEIRLDIDPDQLEQLPRNIGIDIASTTLFGAKSVELSMPDRPSAERLQPGESLAAEHVVVEINTVFKRLTTVLSAIDPAKLNQALGALSTALHGRGERLGDSLVALDAFLARIQSVMPSLRSDIQLAPAVFGAYADAAPDLMSVVDNATRLSQTIVDKQQELDALLVSLIGLSDVGTPVIEENTQGLSDVLRLLVPTTSLTNQYHEALTCVMGGLNTMAAADPFPRAGTQVLAGFTAGMERFRFPGDLPKVAATGGPQCAGLPVVPFDTRPPYVIADVGTNPWKYGNQNLLLNTDGLKRLLFGPIDGPPRNTTEIGHPG
jgi:virulence factor Mce-like protein